MAMATNNVMRRFIARLRKRVCLAVLVRMGGGVAREYLRDKEFWDKESLTQRTKLTCLESRVLIARLAAIVHAEDCLVAVSSSGKWRVREEHWENTLRGVVRDTFSGSFDSRSLPASVAKIDLLQGRDAGQSWNATFPSLCD